MDDISLKLLDGGKSSNLLRCGTSSESLSLMQLKILQIWFHLLLELLTLWSHNLRLECLHGVILKKSNYNLTKKNVFF